MSGVRALYEVCNHYEVPLIHTAAQCRQLLAEMDSDNVRMILDSFHMNIDEPDPLQALRGHGAFTAIYHISDSGRGGIGTGHIDVKAQHEALVAGGFSGAVATELVPEHLAPPSRRGPLPIIRHWTRRFAMAPRSGAVTWVADPIDE